MKHSLHSPARQRTSPSSRRSLRQQGYTLIELSIALAIISVIIVGSLVGVQRILANNRANNLLSEIPRINAALVGAVANSSVDSISKLSTAQAVALGAFTASSVSGTGTDAKVTNPFGGDIFIQGNGASFGGVTRGYIVTATKIPADMCATLVNGLAPLAQAIWADSNATAPTVDSSFSTNMTSAQLIKGPDATSTVNLTTLTAQCRANNADVQTVHAFIAI